MPSERAARDPAQDQDIELMVKVGAGNRTAQCVLAARVSGRVRRVSRALLRNTADADDVAQTALFEILKSAGSYKGLSTIERWADRIVVRCVSLMLRQRRRALEHIDYDTDVDVVQQSLPEPATSDDVVRPMAAYLDMLPEPIRMALMLRHTFGYSLEEIAELVDISPNAAKKRVSRGHQAIRRMIRKDRVLGLHLGERA